MKKNTLSQVLAGVWIIAGAFAFISCSSEDSTTEYLQNEVAVANTTDAKAADSYSLVLKALSDRKDITTGGDVEGVTLFVFDQNGGFIESKTIDKATVLNRRTIRIAAGTTEKITVVAWAGLTNNKEEVSSLNQNSTLTDLRVQLKQHNGQVTTSPGDLFHGQITIDRSSLTRSEAQVLSIERKVAEFSLTTTGIAKKFGATDGDFYYKISTSTSMINHSGEVTGESVEYILPATVNAAGNLTADNIAVLPSSDVTIELYRNDILVLSSKNLKNTQELSISASQQFDIVFDICKVSQSMVVASWGQVVNRVSVA